MTFFLFLQSLLLCFDGKQAKDVLSIISNLKTTIADTFLTYDSDIRHLVAINVGVVACLGTGIAWTGDVTVFFSLFKQMLSGSAAMETARLTDGDQSKRQDVVVVAHNNEDRVG